jgi:branched-chain amino acid transport system permease protein
MTEFFFILIGGLKYGAIYALAGLGLVVVHKATKVVNFAHGGFIMLGAYGTFFLLEFAGLPYWVTYAVTAVGVGLAACAIEWLILRPMRRADMFTVVIATVFLAVALQEAIRLPYSAEILPLQPLFEGPPFIFGEVIVSREALWIIAGTLTCAGAAIFIFSRAGLGRGMRAMAANIRGAQLCGYSVDRTYAAAWFFGGVLAGLAGAFGAPSLGVSPALMVLTIVPAFVAAVIGGFDSLIGTIIGGLLLGIIENVSAAYISSGMKSAVSFIILLAVLIVRPEGLFPESSTRRV